MPNENQDVDLNNEDLELDLEEESAEGEPEEVEQPKEEKHKFSPEEQLAIHERNAKKLRKLLGLNNVETKESKEKVAPTSDLGEKAFLIANGLKEAGEQALAKKIMKETGKDAESVLETTYFQTELKHYREQKAAEDATPSGGKRSNNSSVDTVEYWIAKGELPPASEVELRRKVVNARMKKEESKSVFYNQ